MEFISRITLTLQISARSRPASKRKTTIANTNSRQKKHPPRCSSRDLRFPVCVAPPHSSSQKFLRKEQNWGRKLQKIPLLARKQHSQAAKHTIPRIIRRIFTFPIATLYTEADLILTTAESPEEKPHIDARLEDGHVANTRAFHSELNPDGETNHLTRGLLGTMSHSQREAIKRVNKVKTRARKSARLAYRGQSVLLQETFLIGNDGPADIDTIQQANNLYLALLAIQNAANNEHDEDEPTHRGIRAKYRLGLSPPTAPESKTPTTDPITPPAP